MAAWPARAMHGMVALGGRLWVLGGLDLTSGPAPQRQILNDVWTSGNGAVWSVATLQASNHF